MIGNYSKVAVRNLLKNKVYSFINIFGLAAGMAVALLIGVWIHDELTFNKSIANYDRVGEVWQFVQFEKEKSSFNVMPIPLEEELKKDYPDIELASLASPAQAVFAHGDKKLLEKGHYVESEFVEIMSLKMKAGSRTGLKDVHSVLISEALAKSLFGGANAINQLVSFDDTSTVKVAGIFEDFPKNNRFRDLHFLAPWSLYEANYGNVRRSRTELDENNFNVYVLLRDKNKFAKVSAQIKGIRERRGNYPSYKPEFFIHPMSRWHLYGEFKDGANTGGFITYVWLFGMIGISVLLLACINFMNLSTARSEKRAKEVGIRKTVGSTRRQIIWQFFIESGVCVLVALALSIVITLACLPFFNEVAGKQIKIFWGNPLFWIVLVVFSIITTLVAGSYPALYLSAFRPVTVLKGTFKAGRNAAIPRKVLVVVQFTISVVMIIATIVFYRQVQYIKDRPVGYSRAGVVEMKLNNAAIADHFTAFYDDLLKSGAVVSAATASCPLTDQYGGTTDISWPAKTPDQHPLVMSNSISHDFGKTVGWMIKDGRNFSRDFPSDSASIIINESAAKLMDIASVQGQKIVARGKSYSLVGIVKDMIRASPFQRVASTFYVLNPRDVTVIDLKLSPSVGVPQAITQVKAIAERYDPATPFTANFVDEQYNAKFNDQERIGKLAGFFAILAIIISSLGLFGLASFIAVQRIKEIGIRKTLGATVVQVWALLSKEFVALVMISLFIATPVGWLAMRNWLNDFEYRTPIDWWIFVVVGAGAFVLSLATVSFQSVKAAMTKVVDSLRRE